MAKIIALLLLGLGVTLAQQSMSELAKSAGQGDKPALQQLKTHAEQGEAYAQLNLGLLYSRGEGVPKDFMEAAAWYRRAAEQGNYLGQMKLSGAYSKGEGVPKDAVTAYMWVDLAAAQEPDDGFAKAQRDLQAREMTPEQIAEAQRRSREFKPSSGK